MYIAEEGPKKNLISLTSLIDVVFILLVFFMLSSTFTQWDYIALNTSAAAEAPINTANKHSRIEIHAQQQYLLNETAKTLDEIVTHVSQQLQYDQKHPIIIRADDEVTVQHLVTVLEAIGPIAIHNITLEEGE